MWWETYKPAQATPPPQKRGGILRGVADVINQSVLQPLVEGGAALGKSQQNLREGKPLTQDIDMGKFAKNFVTTGLNFSPLALTKGATTGARIAQGAKIGATTGAIQGGINQVGSQDPIDYIEGALTGGITGGATGGALGGVSGITSKLMGKSPTVSPGMATPKPDTSTPSSFFQKTLKAANTQGQQMEARSGGYGIGAKQSGSRPLGFKASQDINKTLQEEGIKAGNPLMRQRLTEEKLSGYGQQINDALQTANRPLTSVEKRNIANQIKTSVEEAGVDDTTRKHALQIAKNFQDQVDDVQGLVNFRRQLDQNNISYITNPDAATAAKQQAALGARGAVSEATNNIAPDIKDLNMKYHNLSNANDYLIGGAKDINNANGGIVGRVVNSGPVQSAESKLGRGIQKVTGNATETPSPTTGTTGVLRKMMGFAPENAYRTGAPGVISADLSNPYSQPTEQPTEPEPMMGAELGIQEEPASMYSQDNLLKDIQKDPKNMEKYLALYKELNPEGKAAKPLSAEASKQLGNAQSGLSALEMLASEYNKNPNVVNANAVAGLGGNLGRGIAGTQGYEAARKEIIDVLTKLRTGAAMTASEEAQYKSMLPSAFDSPETVAQKLGRYQELFQGIIQRAQAGSPDLETMSSRAY